MRTPYFKLEGIKSGLLLTHKHQSDDEDEEHFKWNELEALFKKMFLIMSINRRAHIKVED